MKAMPDTTSASDRRTAPGASSSPVGTASFRDALAALKAAQKSSAGAPAYSRYVNRPLGRAIAAAASVAGLTPNAITALSALLTLSAIAMLALVPPATAAPVVTALLVAGYAFDAADGQLARLRGGGSVAGEWLDHMVDALKTSALHAAVLVSWFRFLEVDDGMLLIPVLYAVVSAVFFFGVILTDLLRRANGARSNAGGNPVRRSPFYAIAVLPADYGLLCLLFLTLIWPPAFVAGYTLLAIANTVILAASCVRWFRELDRLPRAAR